MKEAKTDIQSMCGGFLLQLELAYHHAAAYAVVAVKHRRQIAEVLYNEEEPTLKLRLRSLKLPRNRMSYDRIEHISSNPKFRELVAVINIHCAGTIAHQIILEKRGKKNITPIWQEIITPIIKGAEAAAERQVGILFSHMMVPNSAQGILLEQARNETKELLSTPEVWQQVQYIADKLEFHGRLTGKQVEKYLAELRQQEFAFPA